METLGEACGMTGWRVHAFVLLSNHYHLMLKTPEPNLVAGMKWLQNTVTRRFNVRHRAWGRVFGDRYKAVLVEGGFLTNKNEIGKLADANYREQLAVAISDGILKYRNTIKASGDDLDGAGP